jgi:hypothetical protein
MQLRDPYLHTLLAEFKARHKFAKKYVYNSTDYAQLQLETVYNDDVDLCFVFDVVNNNVIQQFDVYANYNSKVLCGNIYKRTTDNKQQLQDELCALLKVKQVDIVDDSTNTYYFVAS